MKILVIEDISFSSLVVERYLQSQGHEVLTAKTGHEALTKLGAEDVIDCVVCDLFLPDMNGFQIFQECQRMPKFNHAGQIDTPAFILLTSSNSKQHFQQASVMGFTATLSKPLDIKQLEQALLETGKSGNPVNDTRPKILVVDTKGENHSALKEIFANSDYRIVCVTAGNKALEFLESGQAFKLVVCDTQMPDMDIAVFMNRVSNVKTKPPVVMMSHPMYLGKLPENAAQKFAAIIQYPMNHFELQQRLNQVLSGSKDKSMGSPVQNTILLVDDFSFNITLIKNVLKRCPALQQLECKFETAATGPDALELLKSDYTIFLVLSDLNVPIFGGVELINRYKNFIAADEYLSSKAFPKPHFYLFTQDTSTRATQEAVDAGYELVLAKPLQGELLLDAVTNLLSGAPASGSSQGGSSGGNGGMLSLDGLDALQPVASPEKKSKSKK